MNKDDKKFRNLEKVYITEEFKEFGQQCTGSYSLDAVPEGETSWTEEKEPQEHYKFFVSDQDLQDLLEFAKKCLNRREFQCFSYLVKDHLSYGAISAITKLSPEVIGGFIYASKNKIMAVPREKWADYKKMHKLPTLSKKERKRRSDFAKTLHKRSDVCQNGHPKPLGGRCPTCWQNWYNKRKSSR